jgi:hypothetical protein
MVNENFGGHRLEALPQGRNYAAGPRDFAAVGVSEDEIPEPKTIQHETPHIGQQRRQFLVHEVGRDVLPPSWRSPARCS